MRLFSRLGLETGFKPDTPVERKSHAGYEWPLPRLATWMGKPDCPRVIKNPALCETLDNMLTRKQFGVEHVLVPVRDLFAAAESRRRVQALSPGAPPNVRVDGGLISAGRQEVALSRRFHQLMVTIAKYELSYSMLLFPRLATDPEYLYKRVGFLDGLGDWEKFRTAFAAVSQPELIHEFTPGSPLFPVAASRP